jgi:NAD(P)H-dependent FMN reductase
MDPKPRLAVIYGSTRSSRFVEKPGRWIADRARNFGAWDVEVLDLAEIELPFFDEATSNLWAPSKDPNAVAWQKKLATFDAFLFVTPEYNRSITGALKNALDQAYVEWVRKPMAIVGYGMTGASRAAEHLRTIAIELQMVPIRFGVHIQGEAFLKVHPMGAGGEMGEIEAAIAPSADAMLTDLAWWTKVTADARAEARAEAA